MRVPHFSPEAVALTSFFMTSKIFEWILCDHIVLVSPLEEKRYRMEPTEVLCLRLNLKTVS